MSGDILHCSDAAGSSAGEDRAMKRRRVQVILVTGIALTILAIVLGRWIVGNSTAASLTNPSMAAQVDKVSAAPVDKGNIFAPDTPVIYCTAFLSKTASEVTVKARWTYVQGEAKDLANSLLFEATDKFGGPRNIAFALTYDTPWPRGDYKVVVYLNGQEKFSLPFSVR